MFVSVKTSVVRDQSGVSLELPAILTPQGLLTPLLDYFIEKHRSRSLMWMEKVLRSVRLFLEYMHANPRERDTSVLFQNFADNLTFGTFDRATRQDPSGLCWLPKSEVDANNVITNLSLFFSWLAKDVPLAGAINPQASANAYDRMWADAARTYKRENALLGHLWSRDDSADGTTRKVPTTRGITSRFAEPPAFPEERFEEFITEGFRIGSRLDYRNILITLLLHGGGFRVSEPFHLYLEDVVPDPANPASAIVQIHHPSQGYAPPNWRNAAGQPMKGQRTAYLLEKFGLLSRERMLTNEHAGWKGGLCDAPNYMQAHWFEPRYGELFMDCWMRYMHQVARVKREHPFAFINLGREPLGAMYKLSQFNDAHAAACRRIGLTARKDLGTTPHGHRHAYGRRLKKANIEPEFIRLFMHHTSVESQGVYTQPSTAEIQRAIHDGLKRLDASVAQPSSAINFNGHN